MVNLSDTQGADWQQMAKIYKQLTVGTSSRPITVMLEKANALLPFKEATGIHDSGCGPGPVLARIISDYGDQIPETCTLSASDFSAGMIEQVENTKKEEVDRDAKSPWSRVHASVLDSMDLKGIGGGSQSHVTAGWVYFMTPSPRACLDESLRVLKPGSVLTCSSWKDSQWLQLMGLVTEVRPDAPMPQIPAEWKSAEGVRGELESAGFLKVESVEVDVEMRFDTHDALVELLVTQLPHMKKLLSTWSADEVSQLREVIAKRLKEYCPAAPGKLSGIALVAVGCKP